MFNKGLQIIATFFLVASVWTRDQDQGLAKANSSAVETRNVGLEVTTFLVSNDIDICMFMG